MELRDSLFFMDLIKVRVILLLGLLAKSELYRKTIHASIHWLTLLVAATESRTLFWVSHMGDRGPNIWSSFHYFPQIISKELYQKWSTQDINQHPMGY